MPSGGRTKEDMAHEIEELRARLTEAEEALAAIRNGEVDALLISTPEGEGVYTLEGADTAYRVLVENMREGAVSLLADGSILYANQHFAKMVGLPLEKIIGTPFDRFIHPSDKGAYEALRRANRHNHGSGEIRLQGSGGQTIYTYLSMNILQLPGVQGTCVVVTDLSAQEWLRVTLSSIGDAVIACDMQSQITFINPVAAALTGWSAAEAIGQPIASVFRIINEQTRLPADDMVARALRERHAAQLSSHTALVTRDGREIPVENSAAPILDNAGDVTGVVLVFHDVAEKRRAQEALRKSEEQLRQNAEKLIEADRRKDEFLAMLAHELRNPLAPVRYAVQIMNAYCQASCPGHARIAQQHGIIERQIGHMSRLIEDLLDVARITQGKIELRKELVDLSTALRQSMESCRQTLERKRQELIASLPEEPLWVEGDPIRLEQVFTNLLVNASKYSPADRCIWISVNLESADEGKMAAVVRVRDEGDGISANLLPHIFDLFTQGKRGKDRAQGGLGIGLTMVRSLIQMHGGTVNVQSEGTGKGSEFIVRLPLVQTESEIATPRKAVSTKAKRSYKILAVDDVADSAQSLAELLELIGHQTRTALDGLAALEIARTWKPDIVLLDIGMPGMDGYEVARRLRAEHGQDGMKLIALTGYGQDSDRADALAAGFNGLLVKPVDLEVLSNALAEFPAHPGT